MMANKMELGRKGSGNGQRLLPRFRYDVSFDGGPIKSVIDSNVNIIHTDLVAVSGCEAHPRRIRNPRTISEDIPLGSLSLSLSLFLSRRDIHFLPRDSSCLASQRDPLL